MAASWSVVIDGRTHNIKSKGSSLVIDGEKTKLKNLMSKKEGIFKVYDVPLGTKTAKYYVNTWIGGAKLAMLRSLNYECIFRDGSFGL